MYPVSAVLSSRFVHAAVFLMMALVWVQGLTSARSVDPLPAVNEGVTTAQTNQRRLVFEDLVYKGGFRLPPERSNDDGFFGGGQALAFNPSVPSLFVSSFAGRVAEVTIPASIVTGDPAELPVATFLQGFSDPTGGRLLEAGSWGVLLSSLLVQNGRLFGTASMYYDALNDQRVSHFSRSLRLSDPGFQGWSQVWETGKAGYVAASLATVPVDWQQRLGGAMVSGQCCVPIVSRTSWGPAAFAFDPALIGQATVPASPLLYYNSEHPTLGSWSGPGNERYSQTAEVGGMVLVAGTRTALVFGRIGVGTACYGSGTNDPAMHEKPVPPSGTFKYCYDPAGVDNQGVHAYPYRYQVWAYDLNDFAAVKAGSKRPWDVEPYGIWPLKFPISEPRAIIGGVSYDVARQTIYVTQRFADTDQYESRPVIHTFQIK